MNPDGVECKTFAVDATTTTQFTPLQSRVCVCLARFWNDSRYDPPRLVKDLRPHTVTSVQDRPEFVPTAFVEHIGPTREAGHYIAWARVDGGWIKFNDSSVTRESDAVALEAMRYSYFFAYGRAEVEAPREVDLESASVSPELLAPVAAADAANDASDG
jgi:hypothetical protein